MKIQVLWVLFIISINTRSQIFQGNQSALCTGLGAYSSYQSDVISMTQNPASLAGVTTFSAGLSAARDYFLKELSTYKAALAIGSGSGNFGVQLGYSGTDLYNESQFGLSYARSLGALMDLGLQVHFTNYRISGYGGRGYPGFKLGTLWHLSEKVHTGIQFNKNLGKKTGEHPEDHFPDTYNFGIGFDASPKFYCGVEIIKEESRSVHVHSGFRYQPMERFSFRAGMSTSNSSFWFGVAVKWGKLELLFNGSLHPFLGFSPCVQFLFRSERKKKEDG